MKHPIDLENWNRKEHFEFFNSFDEPYYGVNVTIDVTAAYQLMKKEGLSFYLYYLYQALAASQQIDAFRLRIEGDQVYRYDRIDSGSTILRPDGTFGFGDFIYQPNFVDFQAGARAVMEKVQSETGITRSPALNVIRFSALPWIDFTALSHARSFGFRDSCPKISFGKITDVDGKKTMPVSIHVNHALVDGLRLGEYITLYQELMNRTEL